MKITGLKATPAAIPMLFDDSAMGKGANAYTAVILELFTDEGYTGIAEVPNVYGCQSSKELVESTEQFIAGRDPGDVNVILKELYACYNLYHLHPMAANWAVNSVERAMWDILGQKAELPLYKLWGGAFRKKIPIYGFVPPSPHDLDKMKKEAHDFYQKGYKVIYTKVGFGTPEEDIEMVKAIRAGVPDMSVTIRVDPNQGWTASAAISIINKMEPYGMDCVEQPVMQFDIDGLKRVKQAVRVPIAAHESAWNMYDTLRLIKENAVDIIQLDNRFNIGVHGARVAAGMCEAAGIPVISHAYYEFGLSVAERLHWIASSPACTMAHQICEYEYLSDDILEGGKLEIKDGCFELPEGSGLGVKLDQEKLSVYNEYYVKNVLEAGYEHKLESPIYGAMYARNYLKDLY